MARSTSSQSHVSILVGSSESNSEETNDETESDFESHCFSLDNSARVYDDDVVPTYILKPTEISKNIDLMKTVAILMEGKLRQTPAKCPDQEKIRDLYSDVHRFPEAFQKFTSIIHQIQYLNVTTEWEHSGSDLNNGRSLPREEEEYGNFFTKVFGTSFARRDTTQDYRKKIMLSLLNDTEKVFGRYQQIQTMLEDRLKKHSKLIVKKSTQQQQHNGSTGMDTEEEDLQTPLLSGKGGGGGYHRNQNHHFERSMQKCGVMGETLRKTKRSAGDVQDSIDVLRDLIRWDYKQAVTVTGSTSKNVRLYGSTDSSNHEINNPQSNSQCSPDLEPTHATSTTILLPLPEVEIQGSSCHNQGSQLVSNAFSGPNRKLLIMLAVLISLILILSIITAALSLLKFSY